MGKSGGKPDDTIVTLEEALKRFARKRIEDSAETKTKDATVQDSNVHFADFSPSTKREEGVGQ
jgi:hypothetical protein